MPTRAAYGECETTLTERERERERESESPSAKARESAVEREEVCVHECVRVRARAELRAGVRACTKWVCMQSRERREGEGSVVYSTTQPRRCRDAFRGLRAPSSGGLHGAKGGERAGGENPYPIPLIVVYS
jgi:hypothetical protein